jgi:3-phosphoshikimate 1-carboxyvinyltransferase
MAHGKSYIRNPLCSPDTDVMIDACRYLGARVNAFPAYLEVEGVGGILRPAEDVLYVGNSGIAFRFLAAIAALLPSYTVLTGDPSIRHRRLIMPLLQGLEQLGALAVSARGDGYAPILIRGPMRAGHASLSGEDSQPVSALLIACSFLPEQTTLCVSQPGEKPWIDLTLCWLKKLGLGVECDNYTRYTIQGRGSYQGFDCSIPGDMSSAAYAIAAALITQSELTLHNIDLAAGGDSQFLAILQEMGASFSIDAENKSIRVQRCDALKGMTVDLNDCIDMITLLPVIACFAKEKTRIVNAQIARAKESDRIACIAKELKKMGACLEEHEDGLLISPSQLTGASVESHSDHRLSLSLSVAALAAQGSTQIAGAACIAKTYPAFQADFNAIGATIS